MTREYSSCLAECLRAVPWASIGVLEAVLYGSLVRGDYIPGCSDVDLFLVTEDEIFDLRIVETLVSACLGICGLDARQVDILWCSWPEIYSSKCRFKPLTIYRSDFEENSILLYGERLHEYQSPNWSLGDRCGRLKVLSRKHGMEKVVAGEILKLFLAVTGYNGPWDKASVLSAIRAMGGECSLEVWRAYVECREPERGCLDRVLALLSGLCGGEPVAVPFP